MCSFLIHDLFLLIFFSFISINLSFCHYLLKTFDKTVKLKVDVLPGEILFFYEKKKETRTNFSHIQHIFKLYPYRYCTRFRYPRYVRSREHRNLCEHTGPSLFPFPDS